MPDRFVSFTGLTIKRRDISGPGLRCVSRAPPGWERVQIDVEFTKFYDHKKKVIRLIEQKLEGRWAITDVIGGDKATIVIYFEKIEDALAFRFYGGTSPDDIVDD